MAFRDYLVGEITHDFCDGHFSRREALRRLGLLGVAVAGASALLSACGDDDDDTAAAPGNASTTGAPATDRANAPPSTDASSSTPSSASATADTTDTAATSPTTPATSATTAAATPVAAEEIRFDGSSGELIGAWAAAIADPPLGSVLVMHENRGLTPHFFDVVGRLATDGYSALCVDLLSPEGGTASLADDGAAQGALGAAPLDRLIGDLSAGIDELQRRAPDAKIGAIGFCFGGAMTWSLLAAGEDRIAAAAPFYGPAPEGADFGGATAAVLGIYAELDGRVNASRDAAAAALEAAGLTHEIRTFPGVDHAFFNDTGERYDATAATEAYALVLDWFGQHLA